MCMRNRKKITQISQLLCYMAEARYFAWTGCVSTYQWQSGVCVQRDHTGAAVRPDEVCLNAPPVPS